MKDRWRLRNITTTADRLLLRRCYRCNSMTAGYCLDCRKPVDRRCYLDTHVKTCKGRNQK